MHAVTRITKREWVAYGGLSNPNLSRKQMNNGRWQYYRVAK